MPAGRILSKKKMTTGNKKCFWDTVRQLQDEYKKKKSLELTYDGKLITDELEVSEIFINFF